MSRRLLGLAHVADALPVVRVLRGPLRGARWIPRSSLPSIWFGFYELEMARAFREKVPPGGIVYDIGANVGFYTLLAYQCARRVYAFEPLPRNLKYLRQHIEINHVMNVVVVEAAVADLEGRAPFKAGPSHADGTLAYSGEIVVKVLTLDRFAAEHGDPGLIKIDVEGAESRVLRGARSLLGRAHPTILLAMHGDERFLCPRILERYGYRLSMFDPKSLLAVHPSRL